MHSDAKFCYIIKFYILYQAYPFNLLIVKSHLWLFVKKYIFYEKDFGHMDIGQIRGFCVSMANLNLQA